MLTSPWIFLEFHFSSKTRLADLFISPDAQMLTFLFHVHSVGSRWALGESQSGESQLHSGILKMRNSSTKMGSAFLNAQLPS